MWYFVTGYSPALVHGPGICNVSALTLLTKKEYCLADVNIVYSVLLTIDESFHHREQSRQQICAVDGPEICFSEMMLLSDPIFA